MPTIFENLVNRTGLSWYTFVAFLGLALVLSAVSVAYLDVKLDEFFSAGHWQGLLIFPALTLYILSIIPIVRYVGDHALAALRTLVPADDESFDNLVEETTHSSARGEWIAFGSGVAFGLLVILRELLKNGGTPGDERDIWVGVHVLLTGSLTFGLLFWSVHAALSSGRLMAALHRQPLNVDIFDQGAFEPVGRQSLVNALTFFGGAFLSLLFVAWDQESWVANAIVYGILALVSAIVFFLPMRQTHRALAQAKQKELTRVQHNIVSAYRALEEFPADSPDLGILPTRLSLWKEYEVRVKATRTWPFNLSMVRTFTLSVLAPIAISLVQRLFSQLFSL